MKWHRESGMYYTERRGKIVAWVQLIPTDTGHEYRPYSPNPDRVENGPQWIQRAPCQTLADAKRAATSPVSPPSLPS